MGDREVEDEGGWTHPGSKGCGQDLGSVGLAGQRARAEGQDDHSANGIGYPQRKLGAGEVIVHAAGVLQDGLIVPNIQKAPDMFSKVYAAKAHGAWQLHRALTAL